jgi:hypothetical protein
MVDGVGATRYTCTPVSQGIGRGRAVERSEDESKELPWGATRQVSQPRRALCRRCGTPKPAALDRGETQPTLGLIQSHIRYPG